METIRTPKVENVRMLNRYNNSKPSVGTLYLTATHLIFVGPDCRKETWILHNHIASVDKLQLTATGSPLLIRCKTFLSVTFVIPKERDCHDIYVTLCQLSKPSDNWLKLESEKFQVVSKERRFFEAVLHSNLSSLENFSLRTRRTLIELAFTDKLRLVQASLCIYAKSIRGHTCLIFVLTLPQGQLNVNDLYCFHYKSNSEKIPVPAGWNFFDLQSEYQRMRVPNESWTPTDINKNFELCDTYPRFLCVPSSATPEMLIGSSNFRSKGRLPVLSYLHKNKAAICRCSQPLSGFNARCPKDESMLNSILKANPNASYMYVVDTRPRINAMANRATGKGYENETFYENIKFHFLGIENIHVMRSSLSKLIETCELKSPSMSNFLRGLESSGWLKHIQSILETSLFIAQAVEGGISVIVHCSDGWDRTAQVCSLASLLLDPYYRTINGYQALIEKDWLAFGHKFTERFGHLNGDSKEVSPILTQFIDTTWQIWKVYPSAFQFNQKFLLTVHDHAASCQFGTFIGNSEKERIDLRLSEKTFSLWGYMAHHTNEYMNPLYQPDKHSDFLVFNTVSQNINFWSGMYCRFENGIHPREPLGEILLAMVDHSTAMKEHIKLLQKRINQLKNLTGSTNNENDVTNSKNQKDNEESKFVEETNDRNINFDADTKFSELSISKSENNLTTEMLRNEIDSVALDWKTLRNIIECNCTTPFDHSTRKRHCWKCGDVFCVRCIDKTISLPGLFLKRPVPVCQQCYTKIKSYSSLDSP